MDKLKLHSVITTTACFGMESWEDELNGTGELGRRACMETTRNAARTAENRPVYKNTMFEFTPKAQRVK
jgi:hypothetical protein